MILGTLDLQKLLRRESGITFVCLTLLIEKVIPAGHWIGRGVGALLVVWGLGVIYPAI